jgi:hypothetical protein
MGNSPTQCSSGRRPADVCSPARSALRPAAQHGSRRGGRRRRRGGAEEEVGGDLLQWRRGAVSLRLHINTDRLGYSRIPRRIVGVSLTYPIYLSFFLNRKIGWYVRDTYLGVSGRIRVSKRIQPPIRDFLHVSVQRRCPSVCPTSSLARLELPLCP